jgi:hypothetical protein
VIFRFLFNFFNQKAVLRPDIPPPIMVMSDSIGNEGEVKLTKDSGTCVNQKGVCFVFAEVMWKDRQNMRKKISFIQVLKYFSLVENKNLSFIFFHCKLDRFLL